MKSNKIKLIIFIIVLFVVLLVISMTNVFKKDMSYINSAVYAASRMFITNEENKVILNGSCDSGVEYISISKIKYGEGLEYDVVDDKIYVDFLSNIKYLSVSDVKKKKDLDTILNEENSYVIVKYDCEKKDYYYAPFSLKEKVGYSFMDWEK